MAFLDEKVFAKGPDALERVGQTVTFTRRVVTADPSDGTPSETTTDHSWIVSPLFDYVQKLADGTVRETAFSAFVMLRRKADGTTIDFTPEQGDLVTIRSKVWRIEKLDVIDGQAEVLGWVVVIND